MGGFNVHVYVYVCTYVCIHTHRHTYMYSCANIHVVQIFNRNLCGGVVGGFNVQGAKWRHDVRQYW